MAKAKVVPSLSWEDAPDIITAADLAKIIGIGIEKAKKYFNLPGFPILPLSEGNFRADKEAVKMYFQGLRIKEKPKETILYMILLELKKMQKEDLDKMII